MRWFASHHHQCRRAGQTIEHISSEREIERYRRTNLATISIYMLVDRPHIITPRAEKNRAVWLALFRPKRLHRRPYSGVKLHVARRYLDALSVGVALYEQVPATHDVPSQLA
jgi:hypothetical protein